MSDIASKLMTLLVIFVPAVIFIGLFLYLEKKRKK